MTPINSMFELKNAMSNPYRIGEYFTDGTMIFEVSDDMNENQCLLESYIGEKDALLYCINYEDDNLYTEDGVKIEKVY